MYFCFRASFVFILLSPMIQLQAQLENPLELNGVLYEEVPDVAEGAPRAFLWALELQELSQSYESVVNSDQRKRASILFFNQVSGRDWRKYWSQRMSLVYSTNLQFVNDHAEAFFGITGGFPEVFQTGDRFSLESAADGATRAYLNDKLIAQSLKPGHFEFWLRAWQTGLVMPKQSRGNLLAGGLVSEELTQAFLTSQPPERLSTDSPATERPNSERSIQQQAVGSRSTDDTAAISTESVASQAVTPVYIDN